MNASPPPTRRRSIRLCIAAAVTAVTCAALLLAAALAPAPPGVLAFAVAICIVCPMLFAWELPRAVAGLRHHRTMISENHRAISELRDGLARLPETKHPLGY
jgi:hypothetical protein